MTVDSMVHSFAGAFVLIALALGAPSASAMSTKAPAKL